jgi:hypothetical protein
MRMAPQLTLLITPGKYEFPENIYENKDKAYNDFRTRETFANYVQNARFQKNLCQQRKTCFFQSKFSKVLSTYKGEP